MINTILEKWNIVYAIIFVIGSGLLVDIWAGVATITLFIVAISLCAIPYLKKLCEWIDD